MNARERQMTLIESIGARIISAVGVVSSAGEGVAGSAPKLICELVDGLIVVVEFVDVAGII